MKIFRRVDVFGQIAISGCALMMTLSVMAASTSVTYQYDNAGRLINTLYGDGGKTRYSLDAAGNRKTIQSGPTGTVAMNQSAPAVQPQPRAATPVLLANSTDVSHTVLAIAATIGSDVKVDSWETGARFYRPPAAVAETARDAPTSVDAVQRTASSAAMKTGVAANDARSRMVAGDEMVSKPVTAALVTRQAVRP